MRGASIVTMMLGFVLAISSAHSAPEPTPYQDLTALNEQVREFLTIQSAGAPGRVQISTIGLDPKLKLAPCSFVEAFFPNGGRAWGRTSVGLRCNDGARWTIYVQGNVSVFASYLVAAAPLMQGQALSRANVAVQNGDLTLLPPGIFTSVDQLEGKVAKMSMAAGTVLKQEMLQMPLVIQHGQGVRIISNGPGFSITADGQAQGSAYAGQMVPVRVASGQIITGIANAAGQVEVQTR
jgi:flagella basal body P-ring formation protein FlgA